MGLPFKYILQTGTGCKIMHNKKQKNTFNFTAHQAERNLPLMLSGKTIVKKNRERLFFGALLMI